MGGTSRGGDSLEFASEVGRDGGLLGRWVLIGGASLPIVLGVPLQQGGTVVALPVQIDRNRGQQSLLSQSQQLLLVLQH